MRCGTLGVGHAEEVEDQRQLLGEVGIEQQGSAGDLLACESLRLTLADAKVGAQHLQHGHEGDRSPVRLGLGLEDLDPTLAAALAELVGEATLADPRLGDDSDHSSLPGIGAPQSALEYRHLFFATDEAGEAALTGKVKA